MTTALAGPDGPAQQNKASKRTLRLAVLIVVLSVAAGAFALLMGVRAIFRGIELNGRAESRAGIISTPVPSGPKAKKPDHSGTELIPRAAGREN